MHRRSWTIPVIATLLIMISSVSCGSEPIAILPDTPLAPTVIPMPPDEYGVMDWIDNQTIVLSFEEPLPPLFTQKRLGMITQTSTRITPLLIPDLSFCPKNDFDNPQRLPNGHLSYVIRCVTDALHPDEYYMYTYDFATQTAAPLREEPWRGYGDYDWNAAMDRGIATDGNMLDGKLYWMTPTAMEPIDLGLANILQVDMAPDGSAIAVLGGKRPGLSSNFALYLMDGDGSNLRPFLDDLPKPGSISWSPDGRWLVVTAQHDPVRLTSDVWLVNLTARTRQRIATGSLGMARWSPDGTTIAMSRRTNLDLADTKSEIVLFDVSGIVKP